MFQFPSLIFLMRFLKTKNIFKLSKVKRFTGLIYSVPIFWLLRCGSSGKCIPVSEEFHNVTGKGICVSGVPEERE